MPDAATPAALCRALHVSADYVLLGEEATDTPKTIDSKFAIVANKLYGSEALRQIDLSKYCGMDQDHARDAVLRLREEHYILLRRGLSDNDVRWISRKLVDSFNLKIVRDDNEEYDDALLLKSDAMELPQSARASGLSFWGTVGAVVLGIVIALFIFLLVA